MRQDNLALDRHDTKRGPLGSIGAKLIASFSISFVAVLVITELASIRGIPFTSYPGRQERQRAKTFESLDLIADLKKERLLRWIEERRGDVYVTFNSEMVKANITSLHTTLHEFRDKGTEGAELWALIREEESYRELADFVRIVKSAYGAYDKIYVADAESGSTFLSTNDVELGADVSPEAFFVGAMESGEIYVSDIAIDPQSQRPALHISAPIKDKVGKTIAILAMEINADDIIKPMLHTGEGLGERGEALLVNQDVKILTSLKHPLADGTIAEPLEYQIQAQPAMLAARGEEGIIEAEDYRGEPVLAAYRHIRVSSESGWGMVIKQDQAELYAPLQQDMAFSLLIGLVGTLASVGLTVVIVRGLTRPIRSLSQTAGQVAAGDLDARAPVTNSDEVGTLATTFNAMIQRIQHWHAELEKQVKDRTVELNEANKKLVLEVAERKRAQEALQESESRLQAILDHSPALISIKDLEGNVTLVNRKFEVLDGPPPEKFVGKNVYDLFPFDIADALWKNDLTALEAGGPVEAEEVVAHKDGTLHTYLTVKFPLYSKSDQVFGICTISTDITERKQAEEALRESEAWLKSTIESLPFDFFSLNTNGHYILQNSVCRNRWGDLIGKHPQDIAVDDKALAAWLNNNRRALSGETVEGEIEYTIEGEKEFYHDIISPVYDRDQVRGIVGVSIDITENKRAEREREALIRELEAKNAELERFTYTVSHDLKSPLITIKGFLGLLERDAAAGDVERVKADVARISNAAGKMQQLLEELLELSRIGRLVNPSVEIALGELVREAADLIAGRLIERGVRLEIAPDLLRTADGPTVYGDHPRLREVIENLIDNAVKFMGDQPNPRVEIGARYDGEETVVYVRDNGIGIDPRYHDKVFGLFEKLDQQTEGTGVGLAIVERIVEVHGGRIWVESEGVGHGSTFCFTLPESET